MAKTAIEDTVVEQGAMRYLEDQAYAALLGYKEPVRSAEIIGAIGKEDYSAKLVRHILSASPRFTQIDRRWDLEVRYEDKAKPMERVLREIFTQFGSPMTVQQVANELASIYERPTDYYETIIIPRMLVDESKFFHTSEGLYGLRVWLLDVESDREDDIIFDNDLDEEEISSLESSAAKVDWTAEDLGASVNKFLDSVKRPVSSKLVGFFQWRAVGDAFDPVASFEEFSKTTRLVWLSDGKWANKHMVEAYNKVLTTLADHLAEEVIEEAPQAVVEKAEVAEEVAPTLSLNISERDLDEVVQIVSAKGEAKLPLILETIFELSPRDAIYPVAAEGLSDAMRADSRFTWVGAERWRMANLIPPHVTQIPAELAIPKLMFETPEGEKLDNELEDVGLEGILAKELHNPLVQDVGDQDPITEQDELPAVESVRCVLTQHHKKLGTFPLCQIPKTFFPIGPHLVEVTLKEGGKSREIWVNRDTGLIYDMGKFYSEDMPESGTIFEILKTEKSDEFQYVYEGKTEPLVAVPSGRVEELTEMRKEAKNLTTFELMSRLMPYHRKGVQFVTLFTEVNLVRRTTRRLVASVLSAYYAFYQRPKSALWFFDEKKVDQGFKKAKRKYIRKEQ